MSENGKKVILIIDDDITTLTVMGNMLEKHFEVSLAKTAETAWGILRNMVVDLILLDFDMPEMTGIDFMRCLSVNTPFWSVIPVIFVSGHGTPDVIVQVKKAGAKDFAVKPVVEDVLLEKINAVLGQGKIKTDREVLLKLLYMLNVSCRMGKNSQAEKLSAALSRIHYNVGTDEQLKQIVKFTGKLDYPIAIKKINELVKYNFYESLTG
jgi:DNA-binding response OmpR family regulator